MATKMAEDRILKSVWLTNKGIKLRDIKKKGTKTADEQLQERGALGTREAMASEKTGYYADADADAVMGVERRGSEAPVEDASKFFCWSKAGEREEEEAKACQLSGPSPK